MQLTADWVLWGGGDSEIQAWYTRNCDTVRRGERGDRKLYIKIIVENFPNLIKTIIHMSKKLNKSQAHETV